MDCDQTIPDYTRPDQTMVYNLERTLYHKLYCLGYSVGIMIANVFEFIKRTDIINKAKTESLHFEGKN